MTAFAPLDAAEKLTHGQRAVIARLAVREGLLETALRVAKAHHVTLPELVGRNRARAVAHARQALWAELYHEKEGGWSYPRLAALFGHDHTTINYGVRAHLNRQRKRPAPTAPSESIQETAAP